MIANKNAELNRLTGIYKNVLKNAGVTLMEGRGKVGRHCEFMIFALNVIVLLFEHSVLAHKILKCSRHYSAHIVLYFRLVIHLLIAYVSTKCLQIVDEHTVDVDGKLYSAKHILVSVGGRPFIPDIPGSEYAIDSDAALELPSKPEKIAIVGGGYIALEFAGIFNGLKSEVHVFIRQSKVLRGFDEEVKY